MSFSVLPGPPRLALIRDICVFCVCAGGLMKWFGLLRVFFDQNVCWGNKKCLWLLLWFCCGEKSDRNMSAVTTRWITTVKRWLYLCFLTNDSSKDITIRCIQASQRSEVYRGAGESSRALNWASECFTWDWFILFLLEFVHMNLCVIQGSVISLGSP